ncbi:MAG: formyl transferase [Lachnospiraceae bacterium]|nr:formyl transferase [Lachnospiraceae bacterium]
MKKRILFLTNNNSSMALYNWLVKSGEAVVAYSGKIDIKVASQTRPDIIISYNYKSIIGQEIIDYVDGEIFNLHISLLPWNRGASPNYWSFIENTPKGVSIHKIDSGLDTGDIVVQKELFFDERAESFSSTYGKLHEKIKMLFMENWDNIKSGSYNQKKQYGKGSFHTINDFKHLTGGTIDWEENIASYKTRMGI